MENDDLKKNMDLLLDEDEKKEGMINDLLKVDLMVFFITLKRKLWFIILLPIIFFAVAALACTALITNVWQAECSIIRYSKNIARNSDIPYLYQEIKTETILNTLKNRSLLEKVIAELNLKNRALTPEKLAKMIDVETGRTSIFSILIKSKDKNFAVKTVNVLTELFIEHAAELQNAPAIKMYRYYKKREKKIKKDIAEVNINIDAFLKENKVLNIEKELKKNFEQINSVELDMVKNELALSDTQTKISELEKQIAALPDDEIKSYMVQDTEQKRIKSMELKLQTLLRKYTKENPKVIAIQTEINSLKKQFEKNKLKNKKPLPDQISYGPNSLKVNLEGEKLRAEAERISLMKKNEEFLRTISRMKKRIQDLSELKEHYLKLKGDLLNKKNILKKTQKQIAAAKIAMESNTGDFEIVQKAIPPKWPLPSKKKLISAASGIFGFVLAIAIVLGVEFLDFRVKSKFDFDNVLQIEMKGNIPDREAVESESFLPAAHLMWEEVQMSMNLQAGKIPLLSFLSSENFSGKSFVINQIIDILRERNKKVLYIDSINDLSEDIQDFTINKILYKGGNIQEMKVNSISRVYDKVYFHLNNETFMTILKSNDIKNFISQINDSYDYIFWELFPYKNNRRLINAIAQSADINVFIAKFRGTNKFIAKKMINELKNMDVNNFDGVLNLTDRNYYDPNI